MSHLPMSNYGQYFDSRNQGTGMHNSLNSNQQPTTDHAFMNQASYSDDVRQASQSQYGSSAYDWNTRDAQPSPTYANASRQSQYQTESWSEGGTHNGSHEQRAPSNQYATQVTAGIGASGQYSPPAPNTQRLNHLAYASGLDSADAQGTVQHQRRESLTNGAQYLSQSVMNTSRRVQSPVNQQRNQYRASQAMSYPYHSENASVTSTQTPVSAATALAGAVSRRYPQSSGSVGQSSVSPLIENSRSLVPTPQRKKSPYNHGPAPVTNIRQAASLPQNKYSSTNHNSLEPPSHRPQSRNQNQNNHQTPTTLTSKQTSHTVNSISNLVTRPDPDDISPTSYAASATDARSEMPGYIDPTQVFNPFHKEHEQRKKEIARAEAQAAAKKKAEEEAQAVAQKKAEEEAQAAEAAAKRKAEAEAEAARKVKSEQAALAQARAEGHARAPKKPANPRKSNSQGQAVSPALPQGSLPSEDEMANEMKLMMEKMKEFRSKDPSLFQKLWDNMRGVQSPAAPSPVSVPLSSPQVAQQPLVPPQPQPMPQPASPQISAGLPQPASNTPAPRNRAPKSTAIAAAANGYKVVVENNPEGLPDLGRFPAERRIRTSYGKKSNQDTPSSQPATTNEVAFDGSGPVLMVAPPPAVNVDASAPSWIPAQAPVPGSTTVATDKAEPARLVVLSGGRPPKPPSGSTIWPEDKRNALAVAAVACLKEFASKGYPGNADIEITPKDIHAILEANPSYVDLCEILEKKGFRFHRGQFASQLLANVPFLNGAPAPAKQQPTAPVNQSTKQMVSVAGRPPALPSDATVPPTAPSNSVSAPPSHRPTGDLMQPGPGFLPAPPPNQTYALKEGQAVIKPERPPLYMQPFVPNPKPPRVHKSLPTRPEPPVGSKEAMARKRDFSELIDLTVLSDNEDYVLSKKHARTENSSPARDTFQDIQTQMIPGPKVPTQRTFPSGPPQAVEPLRFHAGPPPGEYPKPAPGRRLFPGQDGYVSVHTVSESVPPRLLVLAKPIDVAEGLTKTYYDPKTVARDVLIASGRHPTERPLNAHMAGLLGKNLDIDSDLTTFDWDAIDPGGPPLPQVAYVEVGGIPPQHKVKKRVGREAQVGAQAVNGANDWKVTVGPSSSSDKQSAKTRLANHTSVLQVAPAPSAAPPPAPSSSIMSNPLRDASNSLVKRLAALRQSQPAESAAESSKTPEHSSRAHSSAQPESSLHTSSNQPRPVVVVNMVSNDQSTIPRGRGRPPKLSSTGKRIGRPPGAKNKTMSISAMQRAARQVTSVTIPSPSPSSPHLPLFKCRWKRCSAQLHNSETLLQHITKLHGRVEDNVGEYACWWRKCQYLRADSDGMWQPVKTFPLLKDWTEHVLKDHIHTITRKQGDGPSTKHIDPQTILMDKARYLADEYGRNTTPMLSAHNNDDLAPDTMTLLPADHDTEDEAAQRSFLKTHRGDKRAGPKAIAEETLRALTELKTNFGPGMGNEGCVLARESVKTRLVQNPAIVRVTEADD